MELRATNREGYRERQGGGEEGGRATERRGEECIDRCHSDVSPHAPVSAGVRARGGGRERRINKSWAPVSSLCFIFCFRFFQSPSIQGMKAGVSWHSRIKERDALNGASLSTRDKEEEVGDNTQQGQKQDF